jgi:hypothetical protein
MFRVFKNKSGRSVYFDTLRYRRGARTGVVGKNHYKTDVKAGFSKTLGF